MNKKTLTGRPFRSQLLLCLALSLFILAIGCLEAFHIHKSGDENCKLCILYAQLAISLISLAIIFSVKLTFTYNISSDFIHKLPRRQFATVISRAPPLFN
jgi:hypothetical protein